MPPLQYEPDETLVQAEIAAVRELAGDYAPLTQSQVILLACLAGWQASRGLPAGTAAPARAVAITQAARLAIAAARAGSLPRPGLVGGIQRLPRPQQLVLSLRFEHDMSDAAIATVLGCHPREVMALTMRALAALMPQPPAAEP